MTDAERDELKGMLAKGRHASCKLTRILLLSKEGKSAEDIEDALAVGSATVERIRWRCGEEGLAAALVDRPLPGVKLKLDKRA